MKKFLLGLLISALSFTATAAPAFVQSIEGNTTSGLILSGVVSGNMLAVFTCYFRASGSTQETAPTDTNGTFVAAINPAPVALTGAGLIGVGIFYEKAAAAGSHTVAVQANDGVHFTVAEFSGLDTSAPLDKTASASTTNFSGTSQATGTTAATTQASELVLINNCLGALSGSPSVGFTDPVSGFTTIKKSSDDSSDLATMPSYKVVSSTGTQTATYNWTDNEANQATFATIATFGTTAVGGGGTAKTVFTHHLMQQTIQ